MTTEQNEQTKGTTTMEINGRPFYVKSDEKGNPRLYDIDTNEEVGYWSQKSGTYVMFSPYEQIMNRLKRLNEEDLKEKKEQLEPPGDASQSSSDSASSENSCTLDEAESEEEVDSVDDEENETEILWSRKSNIFIKFFILMLIYTMCQKLFKSIYVDFVFAFAFTILYTKIVKTVCFKL